MSNELLNQGNSSGMGEGAVIPDSIERKFNWGAFVLSWIWGLGNKTYLPLIVIPVAFIPLVGNFICLGLAIWFGIKGNEWAWKNKKFESEEHFQEYQKKWAIASLIVAIIYVLLLIAGIAILGNVKNY